MKGLSLKAVEAIESLIDSNFDSIALNFLGLIPKISKEKKITFSSSRNSLTSLFLESLDTKDPNKSEEDTLKIMLRIANGYIEALKDRTKSKIINSLSGYIKDQNSKDNLISSNKIQEMINLEMGRAKKHFNLIANVETNRAMNTGTALQIAKIAEEKGEDDPTVFFIVTIDDVTGFYEFILHLLPDRLTPRVWKLSEISNDYYKNGKQYPSIFGLHPHCFLGNSGVQIFTEKKGYVNIKDVKVGERVLTHTGKFKKVLNTLEWYNKKYHGKFIKIKFNGVNRDGKFVHTLRVTPEHQFLTQRGWVEVQDLLKTDKFMNLKTNCATCGKPTDVKPRRHRPQNQMSLDGPFCSRSCVTKYQWSLEEHKINISKKSSAYMKKIWENPTKKMLDKLDQMHSITRELVENKQFWAQKPENLDTLQRNIAKVNQKLQLKKSSKEEVKFLKIIKDVFPTVRHQYILEKWCVDFYIPELKVNIEYDGGGHYLPVYTKQYTMESFLAKQGGRDSYIEKCGNHILRYSEIPTPEQLKEDVIRVSNNSNDRYFFEEQEILSIEHVKNGKCGYKLYDLTVEDDESFIVNGIVSHNCRCKITYLAKGWGFNESGNVAFKGLDWNEIKNQRKEHGLPNVPSKPKKKNKKWVLPS